MVRFETGAGKLHQESASRVEPALPAKIGLGASASLQEVAWHVAQASTRQRRGPHCVSHARLLHSVRRIRTAVAVVETRKAPAQVAEAVRQAKSAPSAGSFRRDIVHRVHLAPSRAAQDLSSVGHAWLDARLARIKATAQQAQGLWSAQTAQRLRGITAQKVPPTGAQLQGQSAHLGTSAWAGLRTSRCAPSMLDGSAPLNPRQRKALCALLDFIASGVRQTRLPVQEARFLRLKALHPSRRASIARKVNSHPQGLRAVPSVSLER
jgi:hypothetical protein